MPTPGYNWLPNDSVTADKLDRSVRGLEFTDGTISGGALQNLTVTRAKISDAAIDNAKVASNTLTPDRLVKAVAVGTATNLDGQLLISGSDGVFAAKPLSGGISVAASGAVTLASHIIQDTHLADNAVTSRIIKAGAVQSHHLNTLLHDTSSAAGAYAATLEGVTLFQGLELKLLILRTNSTNLGRATLALNGDEAKKILKPGGSEFAAYELAGGSILNIVWTGGAWQVVSPWVPLVVIETEMQGSQEFTIPGNAVKLRIRCWSAGGSGFIATNPTDKTSYYDLYFSRAGGGGGAFAEWSGAPGTGGLLNAGQILAVTVSNLGLTKITEKNDTSKVLLHCGVGGSPGFTGSGEFVAGSGGTFDVTSLLCTNASTLPNLISVNGQPGSSFIWNHQALSDSGLGRVIQTYDNWYNRVPIYYMPFQGGAGSNGWGVGGSIAIPGTLRQPATRVTTLPQPGKVIIEYTVPPAPASP